MGRGRVVFHVQDLLADGQILCERRFNSPFYGPIIPFGAQLKFGPISSEDLTWGEVALVFFDSRVARSQNNDTLSNSCKKVHSKEVDILQKETLKLYFFAGRVKYCKKDSRFLPLCTEETDFMR